MDGEPFRSLLLNDNMKKSFLIASVFAATLTAGCAPLMQMPGANDAPVTVTPPAPGMAAVYIYRPPEPFISYTHNVHTNTWLNEECVGFTKPATVYRLEVPGNKTYRIASARRNHRPRVIEMTLRSGKSYFYETNVYINSNTTTAGTPIIERGEQEFMQEARRMRFGDNQGQCEGIYPRIGR